MSRSQIWGLFGSRRESQPSSMQLNNSHGSCTPSQQPPPLPMESRPRLPSAESQPQQQQQQQRHVTRGNLFAPPVPTRRQPKSPERPTTDSQPVDGRSMVAHGVGSTRNEEHAGFPAASTEEIRRRRLEEEAKRCAAITRYISTIETVFEPAHDSLQL